MIKFLKVLKKPKLIPLYLLKLKLFKFLPDEIFIKLIYYFSMDIKINLKNPVNFNEKLQWLKLYDRNPMYTSLVDKLEVRKYVEDIIGEDYLVPLYGVWDKAEDIDFESLPNEFVLKCTHDSGGVVICQDKKLLDKQKTIRLLKKSLHKNYYYVEREWPYKNIEPKIICEKYLKDETENSLNDYKFMCFNGEPKIIQVISGRDGRGFFVNHFDVNWEPISIPRKRYSESKSHFPPPTSLSEMLVLCKKLSKQLPFTRIDLYQIQDKIYFGEITFYPASGYMDFANYKDNLKLGKLIKLPK